MPKKYLTMAILAGIPGRTKRPWWSHRAECSWHKAEGLNAFSSSLQLDDTLVLDINTGNVKSMIERSRL